MADNKFELIVCVVNAGFSQDVMTAARAAGARGGTILRGRGSANPEAEEFFNISIQPEKEIVLILTAAEYKDELIRAVYQESGLSREGQGIAFSLPVEKSTTMLSNFADPKITESPQEPEEPKEPAARK